jgi:hypothetical protein
MTAHIVVPASPHPRHATLVFAVFVMTQILDGALTYVGVSRFGLAAEGNPLLFTSMHTMGVPLALVSAKTLACVCGYILYRTAFHRPLAIAAGLCVGIAIVPWLTIVGPLLLSR